MFVRSKKNRSCKQRSAREYETTEAGGMNSYGGDVRHGLISFVTLLLRPFSLFIL